MLIVRAMKEEDIEIVHEAFTGYSIIRELEYVHKCLAENRSGERITRVAYYNGQFAGSLHLLHESFYPPFKQEGIPEINDFNVIPPLRRLGVGHALMEAAEQAAFERFNVVGIGVGLFTSYGNAQRLYAKRGYIPDGRGLSYNGQPVDKGEHVRVDDDLNLYFTKSKP